MNSLKKVNPINTQIYINNQKKDINLFNGNLTHKKKVITDDGNSSELYIIEDENQKISYHDNSNYDIKENSKVTIITVEDEYAGIVDTSLSLYYINKDLKYLKSNLYKKKIEKYFLSIIFIFIALYIFLYNLPILNTLPEIKVFYQLFIPVFSLYFIFYYYSRIEKKESELDKKIFKKFIEDIEEILSKTKSS